MPYEPHLTTNVSAKIGAAVATHGRTILSFMTLLLVWEVLVRVLGV